MIKIFSHDFTSSLESMVNIWLNDNLDKINIQFSVCSDGVKYIFITYIAN
jgi:hypothetical protein